MACLLTDQRPVKVTSNTSNIDIMGTDKDLYSLPDGPKDLCFNKNDFVKNPFSVDEFLQNHRENANLEIMRDDLGVYLKVLRSAMIELINKDYADFVNLSSNLIGLDKAIHKIQVPLGQLKEEVSQVKSSLDEAITELTDCLEKQHLLQRNKRSLHSLAYVQQSIVNLTALSNLPPYSSKALVGAEKPSDSQEKSVLTELDLIERVASELNQLHFRIDHCGELLAPNFKKQLCALETFLVQNLDELFLKGIHNSDVATVKRCLCTYESLGKTQAAEELFQKSVVAVKLHNVICESALQSRSDGLKGIYAQILDFVDTNMKILLDLTANVDLSFTVTGYHFIVNSLWPEVEKRLELHLSSIFAPGNPDNFFMNYSATQNFLMHLELKCGSQGVKLLHKHPQYLAFSHLWNLPVYFQIRFQEIGGSVETALLYWSQNLDSSDGRFLLAPTNTVWSAAQQCWNKNIFLPQISHRFWKLTLQIFARFYVWTGEALNEFQKPRSPADGHIGRISFLVWLFSDINSLVSCLPEILEIASDGLKYLSANGVNHCQSSLAESSAVLLSRLPSLTDRIVSEVSGSSGAFLRQVSDIPRLFRRTNREVPTKACPYMSAVLTPIREFYTTHGHVVNSEQLLKWLTLICSSITSQFYACVSDVLTSVQKTEESLRRLKKMRDRATNSTAPEGRGLTDDDKIRMQLAIDTNFFRKEIKELGVKTDEVEHLQDLILLVESSQNTQQQGPS